MSDTNTATFSGNLTRDSELRFTTNGKPILNFSLANNTGFGDHERTSFIDCVMFGDRAEKLANHLKKGKPIIVTGEHTQSTWTDKQTGKERRSFELKVFSLSFQSGGSQESGGGRSREDAPQARAEPSKPQEPLTTRNVHEREGVGAGTPKGDADDSSIPF